MFLLTGGPGTGKTTCVRGIVETAGAHGLLGGADGPHGPGGHAPGRSLRPGGQTIHRLLGTSFNEELGEVTFSKNEKEPLEADAVIVTSCPWWT